MRRIQPVKCHKNFKFSTTFIFSLLTWWDDLKKKKKKEEKERDTERDTKRDRKNG
jgi:hypothetical protein